MLLTPSRIEHKFFKRINFVSENGLKLACTSTRDQVFCGSDFILTTLSQTLAIGQTSKNV